MKFKGEKKKKKNLTKAQYMFSVSFFSLPLMIMGFQWTFSVLLHGLLRRKTKKVWCCIVRILTLAHIGSTKVTRIFFPNGLKYLTFLLVFRF